MKIKEFQAFSLLGIESAMKKHKEIIKLENVSRYYKFGDEIIKAVDNVSLTINKGDFVAIIGPSGSGKSTLMHIIGLLDKPTKGRVTLEGKKIENLTSHFHL